MSCSERSAWSCSGSNPSHDGIWSAFFHLFDQAQMHLFRTNNHARCLRWANWSSPDKNQSKTSHVHLPCALLKNWADWLAIVRRSLNLTFNFAFSKFHKRFYSQLAGSRNDCPSSARDSFHHTICFVMLVWHQSFIFPCRALLTSSFSPDSCRAASSCWCICSQLVCLAIQYQYEMAWRCVTPIDEVSVSIHTIALVKSVRPSSSFREHLETGGAFARQIFSTFNFNWGVCWIL